MIEEPLKYVKMPKRLAAAVRQLLAEGKVEDPSDVTWAQEALVNPKDNTKATVNWFKKLVEREGKKHEV